ncbi:unnamed protein product [Sphagnum tenellum]
MAMAEGRTQARYDRVSSVVAAVAAAMVPATGSDHFCCSLLFLFNLNNFLFRHLLPCLCFASLRWCGVLDCCWS